MAGQDAAWSAKRDLSGVPHAEDPETWDSFDLPEEHRPYVEAVKHGEKLREILDALPAGRRHEFMRGLRETLNDDIPKRGDFDNPLQKDAPPARRQRDVSSPDPRVSAWKQAKRARALARRAGVRW